MRAFVCAAVGLEAGTGFRRWVGLAAVSALSFRFLDAFDGEPDIVWSLMATAAAGIPVLVPALSIALGAEGESSEFEIFRRAGGAGLPGIINLALNA